MNVEFITRQAMYASSYIEVPPRKNCCRVKAMNITYSECVSVALGIEHAMRMCRIVLSYVACVDVTFFFFFIFPR